MITIDQRPRCFPCNAQCEPDEYWLKVENMCPSCRLRFGITKEIQQLRIEKYYYGKTGEKYWKI